MFGLLRVFCRYTTFNSVCKCRSSKNSFAKDYCQKTLDINTNVVNIFGICQFGFWTYLATFALTSLRDAPTSSITETKWWRKINLGENKYRYTLTAISFIIGWGMLTVAWMYSLKSVKYLILRKGGKKVTIVTFTPVGSNRMFTLGLENLNCKESRTTAKSQLPIKVKGHYLHYILDMKGEFTNPALFDVTAGLQRKWTK